jgi:hypothetical protein
LSARRFGDRRLHLRWEVVGALWGTLELSEAVRLVDISTTGALIEASFLPNESTQALHLVVDGGRLTVSTIVKRLQHIARGDGAPTYRIGLEFVSAPARLIQSIARLPSPPRPEAS